MDWIHCNICYKQPSQKEPPQFAITSCGHFYCNACLKLIAEEKCKICGTKFTLTELSDQMRPDVQEYFQDPAESLQRLVQIMRFQNGHRLRLIAHSRQVEAKYQAAKEDMKKMGGEIQSLRERNAKLENVVKEYQRRRPTSSPATPVCNMGTPVSARYQSSQRESGGSGHLPSSLKRGQPPSQSQSQSQMWVTPNRLTLGYKRSGAASVSGGSNHSSDGDACPRPIYGSYNSLSQRSSSGDRKLPSSSSQQQQRAPVYDQAKYRNPSPGYCSQSSSTPGAPNSRSPVTPYSHRFRSPATPGYRGTPGSCLSNSSESLSSGLSLVNLYARGSQN